MQHHIQTLVQHLFHKDTLEAVTVKELQQFTESYPFSGVGQLLLAKKLQDTGAPEYPQQAAKTALYFHNPIWPGWLLQEFAASSVEDDWIPATSKQPSKIGLALHTPNAERETLNAERPMLNAESQHPVPSAQEPAFAEASAGKASNEQPETRNPEPETAPEPVDNYLPPWEVAKEAEIQVASLSAEPQAAEEPVIDQHQSEAGAVQFVNETPNAERETQNAEGQEPAFAEASAAKAGNEQPETQNTKPETGSEPELVFESYHTIDYFASQGIKLRLDDLPKDKLAQQLKSFTEWLRSMKRIAPTDENSAPEEIHQLSSIQKIAEHSVEAKEVITEAMAEVWAKQGNTAKAVAIYEKLSLLNPAKNAYFASRISALKAT